MSSIQPLIIGYSFTASRSSASDMVDLAQLNAVIGQVAAKLNEVKNVLDANLRDDDTLQDSSVDFRHLSSDVAENLSSQMLGVTG